MFNNNFFKSINDVDVQNIIKKYLNGYSARKLAIEYGFKCQKSIIKILKKHSISTRSQKEAIKQKTIIFNSIEIDKILLMNSNPQITTSDIAKEFNVDPKIIKKQLLNYHSYDINKFDNYLIDKFNIIDNEEKSYWLGMLAADAYLTTKQLSLSLAKKDLNHLLKFKKFIGVDYNISEVKTKLNNKIYTGYKYTVSSSNFVKSLEKYCLVNKKSFTLKFPKLIHDNLIRHYIRGLIDGDGCFCLSNNRLHFSFISSLEVCEKVQYHLMKNCNVNKTKLEERVSKNGEKYYYLRYCGNNQVRRISSYLYDNASIFLERKKEVCNGN